MTRGHFLKHILTDNDNTTFDIGRATVFLVVFSMVFFEGWDVIVHTARFDPTAFGTGVSALLIGLGAYIFGDKKGEAAAAPVYTPPAPVYTPPAPVYAPPAYVPPPTPVESAPVESAPVESLLQQPDPANPVELEDPLLQKP